MIEDKPGRPSNDAAAASRFLNPVVLYMAQMEEPVPYIPAPAPFTPWVMTITPEMIRQIIREELERLFPVKK
jgi:hypothetical protein